MHFIGFIWSLSSHTFFHSMRISFRSEYGVSFSIICFRSRSFFDFVFFLLLKVLCCFFFTCCSLSRSSGVPGVTSVFPQWLAYRIAQTHTAYKPQIVRQNVLFILYAHCYAFLFFFSLFFHFSPFPSLANPSLSLSLSHAICRFLRKPCSYLVLHMFLHDEKPP